MDMNRTTYKKISFSDNTNFYVCNIVAITCRDTANILQKVIAKTLSVVAHDMEKIRRYRQFACYLT